mmetsp:Transcript_29062/g.86032  ORF Transcript_29062/g.86032 Transcript_29062/m.86032 type:complete len:181 (-) Transcript_29062:38-580(-)
MPCKPCTPRSPQVVFMSESAFMAYWQSGLLPKDGAFVRDSTIPPSTCLSDLRGHLTSMLSGMEAYRAGIRRLEPRRGVPADVYAEVPDGDGRRLSILISGDSIVQDSELRMRPTENVVTARQHDPSWVSQLPPDVVEVVAAACASSADVSALRLSSPTAAAQYVPVQLLRLFVVVQGWEY